VDLVAWQIRIAEGMKLPLDGSFSPRGHAIEARIYAEDPAQNFRPSPGQIRRLRPSPGPFTREDSGVYDGYTVPSHYDPMISKLSAWGQTRREAIARLARALEEYVLTGIPTNISYLRSILSHPAFLSGSYDTEFLGREHSTLLAAGELASAVPSVAAAV